MSNQHTGTPQDPIPMYLYKKVGDKIYRCGGGGGSGSGDIQYVQTPTILEPTDNGSASVLLKVVVTAYSNVFDSDAWADRCFQISKQIDFAADSAITKEYHELTNTLTLSADDRLEANTVYYLRVRDTSQSGLISEWSPVITFTTGDAITILAPTITALGYDNSTTDFVSGLTLQCSAFTVDQEQTDEHVSTSWWIDTVDSHARTSHVWESLKDTVNKLSIVVPEGTLSPDTNYRITCQHHGAEYGDSALGTKEIRTSSDFGTVNVPTLSVEGAPNDVYENPTLTAGTFSNTRDEDTHELTDWEILPQAGGAAVWQSLNDATNKTTITVPKGRLVAGTAYTARVRYKGLRYGWSDWQSVQFNTVAVFASVNTPSLTVEGSPDAVKETPTLTLSAFGGVNVTYKTSHFKILKNADNSLVWESTSDTGSVKVPRSMLEVSTTYKFQGWHESNEGVTSQVVEVVASTKDNFTVINDIGAPDSPTFGIGIPSDEEAEAFISGMTKHPDFYDETKAGYGSWVLPEKSFGVTQAHITGVVKYIPKFYWHPLFKGDGGPSSLLSDDEIEALVPYVDVTKEQMIRVRDKYPYSGVVFASSSAFANESEANAQGFILPSAFIDGGKEKNGFFISPTLTTFEANGDGGTFYFGQTRGESEKKLWRLTNANGFANLSSFGCRGEASDAITIPRKYSPNLCCESVYTVAALSLISLCVAQYTTPTFGKCAWYDKSYVANFPKGINNVNTCRDDPTVAIAVSMTDSIGDIYPTTETGYKKTTHNGLISGITHVHGWLWRPMVGYGCWAAAYRLFDCTKYSISEITVDNVQSDTTMFVPITEPIGSAWSEKSTTPLYTSASGQARLLNCVFSHSSGAASATFGNDYHDRYSRPIAVCGGGWSNGGGAGVFGRSGSGSSDGWGYSNASWGFRVIGYSPLNSDGTTGGGIEPEPEPVDSETLSEPPVWAGTVITYYAKPKVQRVPPEEDYDRHYEVYDIDLLVDVSASSMSDCFSGCEIGYYLDDDFSTEEFFGKDTPTLTFVREGTKVRIKGTFQFTNVNGGWAQLELKLYREIGLSTQRTVIGLKYYFQNISN